ncbi:CRISPR-associated endonuclease Cas2 [Thioalkalivibrio thiocyanodenitrificans]|uniref:CRISPR-associated endonuclease Cas2 n=1 Tax=Thioalkalivibrio thiocyanodenitrificans TaxID=243063 RepID=UPI0003639358|nr:CRISPR-associated endonuclease Cas2 [Thioalkalivibrio thiocyanodenitrificans]
MDEHLYIVTYDISDQKRWRRVFRLMRGYGEWVQLSVFQCRMSRQRHAELIALLDGIIHHEQDHIVILDVGLADKVAPRVVSLGKDFAPVPREPVII